MHTLEECQFTSTEYFDECQECGPLPSCTCLASIVQEWEIEATGREGSVFAYRYQFRKYTSDLVGQFGYAGSYREAMDAIAHAVNCEGVEQ